ncbi:MAG: ABC transporter substrate-binding protein [Bifidobacteriaceae bacterium]|jgi:peptide/nickel transport system substrate-binding protein|nr:ABC transporter substrate-binding protein [Bifidobacteriaceae bacterium]
MISTRTSGLRAAAAAGAAALLLSACGGGGEPGGTTSGGAGGQTAKSGATQIVVDTTFDIKTIDPGREYEPTGQILVKALYDTLLTFADDDTTTVVADLASYQSNDDQTEFTFTMAPGRVFSDGSPVTVDDAVFSLKRLQGLKGNPSFLLDGVSVEKVDDQTLKLTTADPSPALPAVLATPSCGIVNSKLVQENGGSTDESDAAEEFLNQTSAGSGPYVLDKLDTASEAVLVKNPNYNGPQTPVYDTVIVRNTEPATQKMNVERGDSQVALGLSGDMVESLADGVEVESVPSATVVFLLINSDPAVSELTSKPEFVKAVKAAIDYDSLIEIAGRGAAQANGLVPSVFLGALEDSEALKYDAAAAQAAAQAAGATGQKLTLSFPNDIDPTGLNLTTLAERIQSQLSAVGIEVDLAPAPFATEIDAYRDGKEQIGLWYWNPDYMDPANYLAFGPGQTVGLRAGWKQGANAAIEELVSRGYTTGDLAERKTVFEEWGKAMNADGPFVPLVQPGSNVVYQPSVTGVYYNPVWLINVAGLGQS